MKFKLFLILFLFSTLAYADPRTDQPSPLFGDVNGTNAGRYRSVKFTNGSTTNNGDGSVTVTTGSGSGSGNVGIGTVGLLSVYTATTTVGPLANPSLCSAGNYARGIDNTGAATGCTASGGGSSQWLTVGGTGNVGISTLDPVGIGTTMGNGLGLTVMNGNVGIGTWNPRSILEVIGTGGVGIGTNLQGSGLTVMSGNVGIGTWIVDGGSLIVASGAGNVGIGTIRPGVALDVSGTVRTFGLIDTTLNASQPVVADANRLLVSGTYKGNTTTINTASGSYTSGNLLKSDANSNIIDAGATFGTLTDTKLCSYTSSGSVISCTASASGGTAAGGLNAIQYNSPVGTFAGTENVFSFNGANVGIGTSDAKQVLAVIGNVGIGTNASSAFVRTTPGSLGVIIEGNVGIGTTDTSRASFTVMSQGNVGIGTYAPITAFEVKSGTIQATGGLVSGGGIQATGSVSSSASGTPIAGLSTRYKMGVLGTGFTATASQAAVGILSQPLFTEASSGNHGVFASIAADGPAITNAAATHDIEATFYSDNVGIGTASIGSYAFYSNQGNNVFYNGNVGIGTFNTSNFNTNNSLTVVGNIGIGTLSPGTALDVVGTVRSQGFTTSGGYTQTGTVANTFTGTPTFSNATNSAFFTGGNVGISSAAPGFLLDVSGTIRTIGAFFTSNVGIGTALIPTTLSVKGAFSQIVPTLTDASSVATDASLGNQFRLTTTQSFTLSNPTNPTDGQRVVWEIIQDGTGSRVMTLGGKFAFGTDLTAATLTTTASKRDFITAIYNVVTDKWYVVAFIKGY